MIIVYDPTTGHYLDTITSRTAALSINRTIDYTYTLKNFSKQKNDHFSSTFCIKNRLNNFYKGYSDFTFKS